MLEFCKMKWSHNEKVLLNAFNNMKEEELKYCRYKHLVQLTVKYILNTDIGIEEYDAIKFNIDNISEINDGDYQGTLLYTIPFDTYQPLSYEYIITFCGYGSCSGCDTLQKLKFEAVTTEDLIMGYMTLCGHILCNIVKPYNEGWQYDERFQTAE